MVRLRWEDEEGERPERIRKIQPIACRNRGDSCCCLVRICKQVKHNESDIILSDMRKQKRGVMSMRHGQMEMEDGNGRWRWKMEMEDWKWRMKMDNHEDWNRTMLYRWLGILISTQKGKRNV